MNSAKIFIIVFGTLRLTVVSSAQVPSNDFAGSHQGHNDEFRRDYDITVEEDNADFFKEDEDIQLPSNDADRNDIDDDFTDVQLKELENVKNFEDALETREEEETGSASEYNSCPNDWLGYNNKCYRAFGYLSWTMAHDYCRGIGSGGSLATSDTSQLNSFIAKHVSGGKTALWIGLNDRGSEGDFHWVENDEHRHGFSAWGPGQPNNNGGDLDCVAINDGNTDGDWTTNHVCTYTHYFVCQMDEVDI